MKKLLSTLTAFALSTTVSATPINHLVFLGDSLTDNGNLYQSFIKIMPKSPPYYNGRFSNAPVWSDTVENYFATKYGFKTENHAVGGATTIFRNPFAGNLPYSFAAEIFFYFHPSFFGKKPTFEETRHSLFFIWIGANDYTSGQTDVSGSTTQVVDKIMLEINELVTAGAQNFVIINLPDISITPYGKSTTIAKNIHDLIVMHNEKLDVALDNYHAIHQDVAFIKVDTLDVLNDILKDPQKYNQLYNKNLQNVSDSCWTGGYTLHAKPNQSEVDALAEEIQKAQLHAAPATQPIDAKATANYILSNPDLAITYAVEKQYANGATSCEKPDTYVFWDKLHPTATIHDIIADVVIQKVLAQKIVS